MNFKTYNEIYDIVLKEAPHIEFKDQFIDLEAERHFIIPRIISILMGKKVKDKYGSEFQIKSDKDITEFVKDIINNPMVLRFLNKEVKAIWHS